MSDVMSMKDLGKSVEKKFVMDQELQFKVDLYTQTMVAEWVAERIGLDTDESQRFVKDLKDWGLKVGNREFKKRLMDDFAANHVEISENALDRLIALKSLQAKKKFLNS